MDEERPAFLGEDLAYDAWAAEAALEFDAAYGRWKMEAEARLDDAEGWERALDRQRTREPE